MYKQYPATLYSLALEAAWRTNPNIAASCTDYRDPDDIGDAACYLSADRLSGYAIRADGELVGVFSAVRGRGDDLVRDAIRNGATRLDCFDGYLPALYERHGFVETDREPNWTPGGPDVVYMTLRHRHGYRRDISDWWCETCDTVTDYCLQQS